MIVDYPWSKPGGAALKQASVTGVLRYLSHDASKTLQRPEADDLAAHGIAMAVVFEDMATRALDGYQAGVNDAQVALEMASGQRSGYSNLEMPADRPIYFAVDFDTQWPDVAQYIAGAASVLGKDRTGVYGGRAVIEGAANSGYHWLWQAYAWSQVTQLGWLRQALLHQKLATTTINHVDCDVDEAVVSDWGQWFPGGETDVITDADIEKIAERAATLAAQKVWDTIITNDAGPINASTHLGRADVYSNIVRGEIPALQASLAQIIALLQAPKP